MLPELTPKEARVLDLIVRADRLGCPLTIPQLHARLGSGKLGGSLHVMLMRLEANRLIVKDRGHHGNTITLRRPKQTVVPSA